MILVVFLIIIIFFIVMFYFVSYTTHLDMMRPYITKSVIIKHDFKDFKKAFYKKEWCRDFTHRKSFFDLGYSNKENYIHASIVIIDDVRYRFTFLSYIKFLIFINLNKTTLKNLNEIVNNKKYIRKQKLKRIL